MSYQKRKNISIKIANDLDIVVKAPHYIGKVEIEKILNTRKEWIEKTLIEIKRQNLKSITDLNSGDTIYYLGKKFAVLIKQTNDPLCFNNEFLIFSNKVENKFAALNTFLKSAAKQVAIDRAGHFSKIMGVAPSNVKITSAKARWGSCSYKNNICFSYKIACLPLKLIDYIVVHELAHIKQPNHSKKFYDEIIKYMPDYKERVSDLKEFQKKLIV